jgi:hypothetical protein
LANEGRKKIKISSFDGLKTWEADNGDFGLVVALRAALRVLPLTDDLIGSSRGKILLLTFRTAFVVWASLRYSRVVPRIAQRAAQALAKAHTGANEGLPAAGTDAAAYAVYRLARKIGTSNRDIAADVAPAAASAATDPAAIWNSVNADISWIDSRESEVQISLASQLVVERLWIEDVRGAGNFRTNFPIWAREPWDLLKKSEDLKERGFSIWFRWYESLLSGNKTGYFDGALKGDAERSLLIRVATKPNKFWNRDAAIVNNEIISWIEEKKTQLRKISEERPIDDTDKSDADQPILVQRPSSHRFDRHGNRIEASPVTEPPFDVILAETIIVELREKATDALGSLTDNNADDVVRRAIIRLSESLQSSPNEMVEGILLMRANTLSAHRRAYADPGSERERAIRAVLDDLSSSVDNLVDCYPGIRQINANRLALDMQAEQAPEVEIAIDEITEIARRSPAVGPSAPAALDTGREDVRDLTEKLDRETNLARAADYIATRGQIVASRLLDATNFASATLQSVGSELSGISSDTWKEVRKSLPKAVGSGLSKGTEKALESLVEKGPIVALAYWLAGPLAALAVLVPRLKGHAHKANEVKDKVEKKIASD